MPQDSGPWRGSSRKSAAHEGTRDLPLRPHCGVSERKRRMSLQSLLLSSDEKTVRVIRRILSDFEISVDHCSSAEHAVRKLTRRRFEALIVDSADRDAAESVLKSAKASPSNHRSLAIVLVDSSLGLRGGFELGGHF